MANEEIAYEFFRKDDIFFINGTIWRRALELRKKRDNRIFRKIYKSVSNIWR